MDSGRAGIGNRKGGGTMATEQASTKTRPAAVRAVTWESCLRRIRRWRLPPHWSERDWAEECRAEAAAAAVQAARDFDPGRGVPWDAFVRSRIMAGALTRFRREWSFAIHRVSEAEMQECSADPGDPRAAEAIYGVLQGALGQLPPGDRRLIEALYWGGATESEVARSLGISQQAVSKKKLTILHALQELIVRMKSGTPRL
jgi:RNA polymerase sigma factor (sigma-70 family)